MDTDTLVVAYRNKLIVKYTIDTAISKCSSEVLHYEGYANNLSCTGNGKVYMTGGSTGNVHIRIYDTRSGIMETWQPRLNAIWTSTVFVNVIKEAIVITCGNTSYVYNTDHVLQYQITHPQVEIGFNDVHVTDCGIFWGIPFMIYERLTVRNLLTGHSIRVTEKKKSFSVSGTKNGYVYVTDRNGLNVGVYSTNGTFVNDLQIDPPNRGEQLRRSAAVRVSNQETLVAFSIMPNETIAIYKVYP